MYWSGRVRLKNLKYPDEEYFISGKTMFGKRAFDIAVNEELLKDKKFFVSHCLNLGIASQGKTYEEAIRNIEDAITLYLQECPEKQPKKQRRLLPPIATRLFL